MRTTIGLRRVAPLAWLLLLAGGCGSSDDAGVASEDASTVSGGGGDVPNQPGTGGGAGAAGVATSGSAGADHPGDAAGPTTGAGGGGGTNAPDGSVASVLAGPLKISSNPHYFQDANGRALVLAGSHTWNDLQDWGTGGAPQPFDFDAYTKFLVQHGHNFTLLWQVEPAKFCGLPTLDANNPDITSAPLPWARTGPGMATDGGLKFDLTKFDAAFFDRLRSRVTLLNNAGIWVGVYLFTGEFLSVYRCSGDGYPLSGANNINSIDAGGGDGAMSMTAPNSITNIQDAMADKMIDTLSDLPNVLWIVSEEAAANSFWWQGHMMSHIRTYEATKAHQHPVGLGAIGQDSQLYNTDADWVAPYAQISPSTSCGTGTPKCKVNLNDSDHSYFGMWTATAQQNRNYAWSNFTRGNQVAFMDPYTVYYPRQGRNLCTSPKNGICSGPDPRWNNFRDNLGYIVTYSRKLNLTAAQPSMTLCSTGYCLGQTPAIGAEMLVYAPSGGTFTVDLSHSTGRTMSYEWFDPATGKVVSMGSVPGGSNKQSFMTPAGVAGDSVLYIVDSAGHA